MESLTLKVKPEYEALLPKLTVEQYEALKKSISEEGQHYPIAYNVEREILDGHHRFKICRELGIQPKMEGEPRVFMDKLDEMQFVLETNLLRRQLPEWLRILTAKPLMLIYREKAERRRLATLPKEGEQGFRDRQNFAEHEKGKAVEQFAKAVQSNPETVRQALWLEEHAPPEKIAELNNGEKSISKAYNEVKQKEKPKAEPTPLPDGKFHTIVIDPPWDTEKILRDVRPNQAEWDYPVMSLEEIKALPIKEKACDGCHIYLWTTHKYLPKAFEVFESWGVKYECLLTWVKNVGFTPFSWMYSTEHVLFGRIGNLELLKKGLRLDFSAKTNGHSCKPEEFYVLVRQASPEPRLEMFTRNPHYGFESWGNEVGKEVQNVLG